MLTDGRERRGHLSLDVWVCVVRLLLCLAESGPLPRCLCAAAALLRFQEKLHVLF